jgi:hypothetical protein
MALPLPRRRRRRKLLETPFPEAWLGHLERNVHAYRRLPEADRARLRDGLRIFIAETSWEGCGGLEVTDEMKVTIAAQAALMALGFEDFCFEHVQDVLVYPGSFVARDEYDRLEERSGEAHCDGKVILSWREVLEETRTPALGRNVVVHELAHQLDMLTGWPDGLPPIADAGERRRWKETMDREREALAQCEARDRPSVLDYRGADDDVEFFAAATECFFQRPEALREERPRLYSLLSAWYRQDPARAWGPPPDDAQRSPDAAGGGANGNGGADDERDARDLEELSDLIRRHPDLPDPYRERALILSSRGDYEHAIADYTQAIALAPDDPELYVERGDVWCEAGDPDRAIRDFSRAVELCPDYAWAHVERALAFHDKGALDEAIADCSRALRLDPDEPLAYLYRGHALAEKKELDNAVADFTRAIALDPNLSEAYAARASVLRARQELEAALADCDRALALDPEMVDAYEVRALVHRDRGDVSKARADERQARKLREG